MIVGVKAGYEADVYFEEVKENLQTRGGFTNVLKGGVKRHGELWVIWLEPLFPEFYKYGIVLFLATFFLRGWLGLWTVLFYIICGLMVLSGVFWSRYFYQFIIGVALRRKHPGVSPVFFSSQRVLQEVLYGTR